MADLASLPSQSSASSDHLARDRALFRSASTTRALQDTVDANIVTPKTALKVAISLMLHWLERKWLMFEITASTTFMQWYRTLCLFGNEMGGRIGGQRKVQFSRPLLHAWKRISINNTSLLLPDHWSEHVP
jgi:hypothetical protein